MLHELTRRRPGDSGSPELVRLRATTVMLFRGRLARDSMRIVSRLQEEPLGDCVRPYVVSHLNAKLQNW
jgi:hypothetical protein